MKQTHLLHARRLATLAPKFVSQHLLPFGCGRRRRGGSPRVHEFGVKCERIALQNVAHGFLPLRFVGRRVGAVVAAAVGAAVDLDAKALAVEFQALGLFARAAHVFDFVPVDRGDLSWRTGQFAFLFVGFAFGGR